MHVLRLARAAAPVLLAGALVASGTLALLLAHPAAYAVGAALLASVPFAFARVRRRVAGGSLPRLVAAFTVAAATAPLARLALWNAHSPVLHAAGAWNAWLSRAVADGWHAHEVLPLPAYALFLVAVGAPLAAVVAFVGLAPFAAGHVAAALGARAVRARPRLLVPLAVVGGLVLGAAWPLACEASSGPLGTGEFVEDTRRCRCLGFEVPDYPPGVSDAAGRHVCVGLEVPD